MPTVLVVDDQAIVREPIAAALRERGYVTVCAANGREAVALANQHQPDLILLDLNMPGLNGLAVLRSLRAGSQFRRTPVLILTVSTDKKSILEVAKLGVNGYVLKSRFSMEAFLQRVDAVLNPDATCDDSSASGVDQSDDSSAACDATSPAPSAPAISPCTRPDSTAQLQNLKPIVSRSHMQELLDNCGELKALSPTVAQVMKMTQSRECSMEAVAGLIKQDQAISLKLLKLANSSVYNRGEPADTVQKAVMRIGLAQVRQMVLNLSVVDQFSIVDPTGQINAMRFWEHSIAAGIIAAELTRSLDGTDPQIDASFTMGLLHDVGRLVYLQMLGETYVDVLTEANHLRLPLEQVESRLLLINHADAMDRILHRWNFPKELINPIALHHHSIGDIRRMSPRSLKEVAVLALANRMAHAMLLGSSGNPIIYPIAEFTQALNVTAQTIDLIADMVPEQAADLKFAMLSQAGFADGPDVVQHAQVALNGAFQPIFISPDPQVAAMRLLCQRLAGAAADQPPTIAIVELPHVRFRATVSAQLLEAELSAGVTALPLILISPSGDLLLEDRAMTGRTIQQLNTPTALADMTDAVAALKNISVPTDV